MVCATGTPGARPRIATARIRIRRPRQSMTSPLRSPDSLAWSPCPSSNGGLHHGGERQQRRAHDLRRSVAGTRYDAAELKAQCLQALEARQRSLHGPDDAEPVDEGVIQLAGVRCVGAAVIAQIVV